MEIHSYGRFGCSYGISQLQVPIFLRITNVLQIFDLDALFIFI